MAKNDFYIAGRWRNKEAIQAVLDIVRASGKTAYCFIENKYEGEKVEFDLHGDADAFMKQSESLALDDPLVRKIFEMDIRAERDADAFLMVLPAGLSAHMELGVAYGLGKKCYAVGELEKTETLYCMFDKIFPDLPALKIWLEADNG